MSLKDLTHLIRLAEDLEDTADITVILRTLLAEENTAAASYTEKAKKMEEIGRSDIAKALLDIAEEELVHAGELEALLEREGLAGNEQAEQGYEEIEELLGGM
jgi:rubrerythrin